LTLAAVLGGCLFRPSDSIPEVPPAGKEGLTAPKRTLARLPYEFTFVSHPLDSYGHLIKGADAAAAQAIARVLR